MWKVERVSSAKGVELRLCGRIQSEELMHLNKVFAAEGRSRAVVLDLEEVKLVDQGAVTFLARCEARGTELRNCPAYIREWITREQSRSPRMRRPDDPSE
jgi:hypothetical protein